MIFSTLTHSFHILTKPSRKPHKGVERMFLAVIVEIEEAYSSTNLANSGLKISAKITFKNYLSSKVKILLIG
jgi:hypothetical protein